MSSRLLWVPKGIKRSWDEAKGVAHNICESVARDNPNLYLIKMAKNLCEGRLFLDHLGKAAA